MGFEQLSCAPVELADGKNLLVGGGIGKVHKVYCMESGLK